MQCMIYTMDVAKLFMNGRSQAVRLPRAYRFADKEVSIRRQGETVILEPIKKSAWPKKFWKQLQIRDAKFARPPQGVMPSIPDLETR